MPVGAPLETQRRRPESKSPSPPAAAAGGRCERRTVVRTLERVRARRAGAAPVSARSAASARPYRGQSQPERTPEAEPLRRKRSDRLWKASAGPSDAGG